MKDFKELYEQAIEETFSGELHKILYENELTNESLTTDHVEALRNLFQRYTNLRNLGNAVFVDVGLRDRIDAINEGQASNDSDKYDASQKDSEMTIEQINADHQMNIIAKAIAIMAKQDYENMDALNFNKCMASDDSEKGDEGQTTFTRIMDVIHDTNANLPYICTRCCSELWESTKYCPHCRRRNTDFKEEKE